MAQASAYPHKAPETPATRQESAALPDLVDMLVAGGDERIALDLRGCNRYGHGPVPAPADIAFGSSTASTISSRGWNAAGVTYDRIATALRLFKPADVYDVEAEALRQGLRDLFGWTEADQPHLVLARSGTDAHAYAAHLCAHGQRRPTMVLTVENAETGSGVSTAITASDGAEPFATYHQPVASRCPDGKLRDVAAIAHELGAHLERAASAGHAALLVVTDVSKSGLISPPLEVAFQLRARYGSTLEIMIDACQLRLSRTTLRAYLQRDCLLALTGSKFMTGPAFSGMLICPARFQETPADFMPALSNRSQRGDWPPAFLGRDALPAEANFGLLLRWSAALCEMDSFFQVPDSVVKEIITQFATMVRELFAMLPELEPIATARLDRAALAIAARVDDADWDALPTIFPFALRTADGRRLNGKATRRVYAALMNRAPEPAIRLGQPVLCGDDADGPIEALRLCLSARQVSEAATHAGGMTQLIEDARRTLEATARLAATLDL